MSYTKKADCGQTQIHRLSRKAHIGRWGLCFHLAISSLSLRNALCLQLISPCLLI